LGLYNSRFSYVNGGYYVKNGVCHFKTTLIAKTNLSSGYSILDTAPKPNSVGVVLEDAETTSYDSSINYILTNKNVNIGDYLYIVGEYETSDSDIYYDIFYAPFERM